MKNSWFIIFFLSAIIGVLFFPLKISAQRVELYLGIKDTSITAGGTINGTVIAKVYAHTDGTPSNCNVSIYFDRLDPGTEYLAFPCQHDSALATENYTSCEQKFIHVYPSSGEKILMVFASCGGRGAVAQKTQHIIVSEKPVIAPITGFVSALKATTTAGIIRKITEKAYWIISSLFVLIIIIGGFYIIASAGDPSRVTTGKKIITYAIIGFVIMAIASGIIELIRLILGVKN